jgi:hypothetical protein
MALTTAGSIDPQPNPRAAADAATVYGQPANATRMNRESGTAVVASAHTSSTSGQSAIDSGFITGDQEWTKTAGKQAGASLPGTPGFPGDTNWPPAQRS